MQFSEFNRELLEHLREHSFPLNYEEILKLLSFDGSLDPEREIQSG